MRKISKTELKNILDNHGKWLRNEKGGERADLSNADLSNANLSNADLRFANLRSADLILFQYQQHQAFYTFDGSLRIGCIVMPITEWAIGFEEIGKGYGYTKEQILMYGQFINQCLEHFKRSNK